MKTRRIEALMMRREGINKEGRVIYKEGNDSMVCKVRKQGKGEVVVLLALLALGYCMRVPEDCANTRNRCFCHANWLQPQKFSTTQGLKAHPTLPVVGPECATVYLAKCFNSLVKLKRA